MARTGADLLVSETSEILRNSLAGERTFV